MYQLFKFLVLDMLDQHFLNRVHTYIFILRQFNFKSDIYFNNSQYISDSKTAIMAEQATSTEFQEPQVKAPVAPQPTQQTTKFNSDFYARTRTTIYMLVGFVLIIGAGHIYSAALIFVLNFMIFSEINSIKRNQEKEVNIPMTKYINWYLFIIVNYFCFGSLVSKKFPIVGVWNPIVGKLLLYHNFTCFCLLIIGFLAFVLSLKQGYLKYQFRLFGWIFIATILICAQAWLMIQNIFQGMIWFIETALLIISNDIFAYIFGYFFGKTRLIQLSPKKTWQGFIGGGLTTIFMSLLLTSAFIEIPGVVCPVVQLTLMPFQYPMCESPLLQTFSIPYIGLQISQLQLHMLILALFASTIGPFGGFFASGLKRSIKIKDFANLIPGHGGVSDRMDCQIVMGSFTYFYLHTIVLMGSATYYWINLLSPHQQMALFNQLKDHLNSTGLLQ